MQEGGGAVQEGDGRLRGSGTGVPARKRPAEGMFPHQTRPGQQRRQTLWCTQTLCSEGHRSHAKNKTATIPSFSIEYFSLQNPFTKTAAVRYRVYIRGLERGIRSMSVNCCCLIEALSRKSRRYNKIPGFSPVLGSALGCFLVSFSRCFVPPRLSDEHNTVDIS